MKKLILGLLLMFNFSYCEENLHLAQKIEIITLTSSYGKQFLDYNHIQVKEVIEYVLEGYEKTFGSKSLANVSMCLAKFKVGYHKDFSECKVTTDLVSFNHYVKNIDEDYYDIIVNVTTLFGMALIEIGSNRIKEIENEKKNKKRI